MERQEILKKCKTEEDRLLISKVIDKVKMMQSRNCIMQTDFLNLHEKMIIEKFLLEQKIASFFFFGGNDHAERTMLFLYPEKITEEIVKAQISNWLQIIRIGIPNYIEPYTHREYLGGIMKLGMKREKIGDILVEQTGADIVVEAEVANFLKNSLQELTRFRKAKIEVLPVAELKEVAVHKEEVVIIVPSMRIDSIVAELAHVSRTKVIEWMNQERIFLNFEVCLNRSKILKKGDIVTIRGKGRFEISDELGSTKKDNIRVCVLKNC